MLRNKKTGQVVFLTHHNFDSYHSLAELNAEWEDYEETKEDGLDNIISLVEAYSTKDSVRYPKDVVDKLKAWKRLKDKGLKFEGWNIPVDGKGIDIFANYPSETKEDLDLLFGGEE